MNDKVVELSDAPQSCVGVPAPVVIGDERTLLLAYEVEAEKPGWKAGHVLTDEDLASFAAHVAVVEFVGYRSYSFGAPNDEALAGHPLYERGLRSYGAFEVEASSWITELERRNSVHPRHRAERFKLLHHYIFTFHDSTFECVAKGYRISEHRQPISELLPVMISRLS